MKALFNQRGINHSILGILLIALLAVIGGCEREDYLISYAPFVTGTEPHHAAVDVPVMMPIKITFNEEMDPSSFSPSSFKFIADSSEQTVAGTVEYSGFSVTFTPTVGYDYKTEYQCVLSDKVTDAEGTKMRSTYTFGFSTVIPPPIVTSFEPTAAYNGDTITIHGSEFGSQPAANVVRVGNQSAFIVSADETTIRFIVPYNASTSLLKVITSGGEDESAELFFALYHGQFWNEENAGVPETLNDLCYDGTKYIAVGDNGTIMTSFDAVSWTRQSAPTSFDLYGIARANGTIIAVGEAGTILKSGDGIFWESEGWTSEVTFFDVAFGDESFVAVGSMGTVVEIPMDAPMRAAESGVFSWLYNIVWADRRFVVVGSTGSILTSPDTFNWYLQGSPLRDHLLGVGWSDSLVVAVGYNGLAGTSPTGNVWTRRVPSVLERLDGIVSHESRTVAVGGDGVIMLSLNHGIDWVQRESPTSSDLNEVIWDGTRYIAIGANGTVLISN